MELPRNEFKAAIRAGRRRIGLWCAIRDPLVAELLGGAGFDWLVFDTEHAAMDPITILPMLQAVAPYPVHPIVRAGSLDPVEIKRLLDLGAQTILIPYVQSVEEARLAAASVAYPPEGIRGVAGATRANRFGAIEGYPRHARDEICLIVQIETRKALDALEEIAQVPGIDAIFVGPADLAASLGFAGEPSHPEVKAACLDAIRRVRAAGLPVGFLTRDQEFLAEIVEAGAAFVGVDVDASLLRRAALEMSDRWRERIEKTP